MLMKIVKVEEAVKINQKRKNKKKDFIVVVCVFFSKNMAASALEYLQNQGKRAIPVVGPNQTLLSLDSIYRPVVGSVETPANFNAKLSSPLEGDFIQYSHLFWNQPLFCHNLSNNELIFSLQDPNSENESPVFVVFAMPFTMIKEYDGNLSGTFFATPKGESYAAQMEYALNFDCRTINNKVYRVNGDGKPYFDINEPVGIDFKAIINFRYSSCRGFAIWATKSNGDMISIKLHDCSWISQGHNIHGFGRLGAGLARYIPYPFFQPVYYAETMPTLLPYRYLWVTSSILTKERRNPCVANAENPSDHKNAVCHLIPDVSVSGIYHEYSMPSGSSPIYGLRSGTQPYEVDIQIRNSLNGDALICDNPLTYFLNSFNINQDSEGAFDNSTKSSIFSFYGRPPADSLLLNWLIFGSYKNWGEANQANPAQYQIDRAKIITTGTYLLGQANSEMQVEDLIHTFVTSNKIG